ncbi:MAG: nodulation protein NfeD [Synergistetes bacterium]|nr:nodulation protein NfeD [Synergistota bacterium]
MGKYVLLLLLFLYPSFCSASSIVYISKINGFINSITVKHVTSVIKSAENSSGKIVIFLMDTPGGLLESARQIVKLFLSSKVPIVVFVYPKGARAASAGTFIAASANVIAMSPGTVIGAAHPVSISVSHISADTKKKIVNYLVAYIRAIAKDRNRPFEWFENAVKNSATLTADEAFKRHVADFLVSDVGSLLKKLNGYPVVVNGKKLYLNTNGVEKKIYSMSWDDKFLHAIGNPNMVYVLLLIAFYGIIFELASPGAIFPGVAGAIALLLFLFALHIIPVNSVGVALIVLAIILFIVDLKVPSHGILSAGGIVSLLLGSFMLVGSKSSPMVSVSISLIFGVAGATAAFFVFALSKAIVAQRRKAVSGKEGMIGEMGYVIEWNDRGGVVLVHGERWNAVAGRGVYTLKKGDRVRVKGIIEGLTLVVEELKEEIGDG